MSGVLLALRFTKFVGVLAFTAGITGAVLPQQARALRQRSAYWLATPGFLLTALAGFGLTKTTGTSLGTPWVAASILLSLLTLDLTIRSVEPETRPSTLRLLGIIGSLLVTLALMVWRPGGPA